MPVRVLGSDGSGHSERRARASTTPPTTAPTSSTSRSAATFRCDGANTDGESTRRDRPRAGRGDRRRRGPATTRCRSCDQPAGERRLLCVGAVDRRASARSSPTSAAVSASSPRAARASAKDAKTPDDNIAPPGPRVPATPTWPAPRRRRRTSPGSRRCWPPGIRGQAAVQRILTTATDAGAPGPGPRVRRGDRRRTPPERSGRLGLGCGGGSGRGRRQGARPLFSPSSTSTAARACVACCAAASGCGSAHVHRARPRARDGTRANRGPRLAAGRRRSRRHRGRAPHRLRAPSRAQAPRGVRVP